MNINTGVHGDLVMHSLINNENVSNDITFVFISVINQYSYFGIH